MTQEELDAEVFYWLTWFVLLVVACTLSACVIWGVPDFQPLQPDPMDMSAL